MLYKKQRFLALGLFFFSGFSALVYEIVWTRLLTLVFGSSIEAISAVITAFMFGLALGSYFAGRHSDYIRKHLAAYGITEILIALSSILLYHVVINLPYIINMLRPDEFATQRGIIVPLIYLLNFLLVAIPTTLMGATFPLMSKHFVRAESDIGLGLGTLYGVNTLGAVLGCFFCGFVLIPELGVRETNYLAVFISMALGITALIKSGSDGRKKILNTTFFLKNRGLNYLPLKDGTTFIILLIFLVSGFASMAYEVAWTRLLVLIIGNSTYAFSAILTTFLIGLAFGSLMMARLVDRIKALFLLLALLQISIFLFVAVTLPYIDNLPDLFLFLFNEYFDGFVSIELITFFIVAVIVFIPTMIMGATFPVVTRLITSHLDHLGSSVGLIYAFNTIGGIFGAILSGFYYIPAFGIEKTLLLISSLNLFAGIALVIQSPRTNNVVKTGSVVLAGSFFAFYVNWLPTWNESAMNKGVYVSAGYFKSLGNPRSDEEQKKGEFIKSKFVWLKEGKMGTVAVRDVGSLRALQVNGKTEGSTDPYDMRTQTMVSALPLMLKADAKRIAIIGLGTGVSLGIAEQFPLREIDCLEISEEVVMASTYFSKVNHDALNNPLVNLIIADGRNYLSYTDRKYDVIISEPSNPWITGVSNLFTVEFFEIARQRLNKHGILAQWVQLYGLRTTELKTLLKTVEQVFPHVNVWMFSDSDLIILASPEDNLNDYSQIEMAFFNPVLRQDLYAIGIKNPNDVLNGYLFGTEKAVEFAGNSRLNTDNDPVIEFEAPKSLYNPSPEKNVRALKNCC